VCVLVSFVMCVLCMCVFCNEWVCVIYVFLCVFMCGLFNVCVCVAFGMCGLCVCVCVCGFCNGLLCKDVGFVMCGCVYVWFL